MKFFEKLLRFFGYLSIEEIEVKRKFAKNQIKVLEKENKEFRKTIKAGGLSSAILDDLRHNCSLLPYYAKEVEKWNKKLKKRRK